MEPIYEEHLRQLGANDDLIEFVNHYFVPLENFDVRIIHKIRDAVLRYFGIPLEALFIRSRNRQVSVKPRQIIHYYCKKYTTAPLELIGGLIGGKDHATVLHSVRTVENDSKTNRVYAQELANIEDYILKSLKNDPLCRKGLQIPASGTDPGLGN